MIKEAFFQRYQRNTIEVKTKSFSLDKYFQVSHGFFEVRCPGAFPERFYLVSM